MNMKVNNEKPMNYERPQDRYEEFEKAVKENFSKVVENNKHLYQVKVDGLWGTYLNNLPEDGRFAYDCRACKHFIERYGNLVTISDDGHVESALWYLIDVPPYFAESVLRMNNLVKNSNKIHNVFISDVKTLEAYFSNTPIECAETADACGIGFTTDSDWNVLLRVTLESGNVRLIKIDRFD